MDRLDELLSVVANGDSDDVGAAADAIRDEAKPDWLPRLREALLHGEDFCVREIVAQPVAAMQGIDALPDLLEAFRLGVAENHDHDGLAAIICDLVEESSEEAFRILVPLASSSDSADRSNAAWLLDCVKRDDVIPILERLLKDEVPEVVETALRSLVAKGSPEAIAVVRGLPWLKRLKYRKLIAGPSLSD